MNGNASAVTGAGPWSWTCTGVNNLKTTCSANIATYTITFRAGLHGRISSDGPLIQTVPYGGSTTEVTTRPDDGYQFVNWIDQSRSVVSTADPLILTNVASNRTVTAIFAPEPIDSVLHADLSPTDDRIPVDDINRFPDSGVVRIDAEQMRYKGKKPAVIIGVVARAAFAADSQRGSLLIAQRGINQTTPAAHSAGAAVVLVTSRACVGDCTADGEVTVNELITAVNIALGNAAPNQCFAVDANTDGEVTINELISGVNNALTGCPG